MDVGVIVSDGKIASYQITNMDKKEAKLLYRTLTAAVLQGDDWTEEQELADKIRAGLFSWLKLGEELT